MQQEIRAGIETLLAIRRSDTPLGVRPLVVTPRRRYSIEKLEFVSEPGVYIPTWVFVPHDLKTPAAATLFVHEAGKQIEGMEFGRLERMAQAGELVAAIDVRGIGDTRPLHSASGSSGSPFRHLFDVETAMSYMAWFMDESLFGMRVQDVIRGIDYLVSRGDAEASGVRVIGCGMGALWTLFAAALDPRIQAAVCEGGLISYRALCQSDCYLHGASVFIRNVLLRFDLPHVAAAVAGRKLTLVSPVDAMKRPVDLRLAESVYHLTRHAYRAARQEERFRIAAD